MTPAEAQRLATFAESALARWRPWSTAGGSSPQRAFIRAAATHRTRMFRAGNRAGKTTCGAEDLLLHLTGWHPCSRFKPPVRWWASGLDWEFGVGQVLWPALRDLMPWSEVRSVTYARKRAPELPLHVLFKNGSELTFKSADSGARKYQGAKLHGLWLDEEHPPDVVEEGRARLLDLGGYLNVTLTPVQRMRWVQELEREPDTLLVRASMLEAAHAGLLDVHAVERYAASLPERQRRVRVHGDFVALEGAVYPEFSAERNVAEPVGDQLVRGDGEPIAPWPLPDSWPRFAAIDFGFANPTAVPLAALDPNEDRLIVYRCWYAPGIRSTEWGELLGDRLPALERPLVADHDANARAELEAQNVPTTAADKDIDVGLEAVSRWLHLGALVIVKDGATDEQLGRCDAAIVEEEVEGYHYPKQRDERPDVPDRPVKKNDHSLDAVRYLVREVEEYLGRDQLGPDEETRVRAGHDPHADDDEGDGWGLVTPRRGGLL